jgi:hypothetical protein
VLKIGSIPRKLPQLQLRNLLILQRFACDAPPALRYPR